MDQIEFRYKLESISCDDITDEIKEELLKDFDELVSNAIFWSVNDFEEIANEIIAEDNDDIQFDENKYEEALKKMIHDHNAKYGITWDTIHDYLVTYCQK
jgi:hypothetical protein